MPENRAGSKDSQLATGRMEACRVTSGSLFAGIGGFDLGFRNAGIKTLWMAEKEPFCQAILRTHFPDAELFGDVAYVTKQSARPVDVLTAGFPCQDLSVAGKRAGLEGARSGLFWEVVRILGQLRPPWLVLENVPGLFSSGEGRDFAIMLNALDELGYGVAWRVLNSQFFGVAQRRRRVFIVGRFGKPCPKEVLFEPESCGGDTAQGREAWPDLAATITDGTGRVGSKGCDDGANLAFGWANSASRTMRIDGTTVDALESSPNGYPAVAAPLTASYGKQLDSSDRNGGPPNIVQQAISSKWAKGSSGPAGDEHHNLTVASLSGMGSGGPDDNDGQSNRIVCGCWDENAWHKRYGLRPGEVCANAWRSPTDTDRMRNAARIPEGVDDVADYYEGWLPKGQDSARYRALGNAVTAKVARWIGKRMIEASR